MDGCITSVMEQWSLMYNSVTEKFSLTRSKVDLVNQIRDL